MPNTISVIAILPRSAGSTPEGLSTPCCMQAGTGSANGNPRGAGYIVNFSVWPMQNLQLAAQYIGYTRFNGAAINYDAAGRNANSNNTVYLHVRFVF